MKGNVLGFDPNSNLGAISGFDGQRYDFTGADWYSRSPPRPGDTVDFSPEGGHATRIYLLAPEYVTPSFGQFYFSPSGRISRSQFWLQALLPIWGVFVAAWALVFALTTAGAHAAAAVLLFLLLVYFLATIWPLIAVHVKRIHDRNKPGWVILTPLIPALVTVIISIVVLPAAAISALAGGPALFAGVLIGAGAYSIVLSAVQFVIAVWFFIEFGCLRGTIGPNAYGPDPVR